MQYTRIVTWISTGVRLANAAGLSGLLALILVSPGSAATIHRCIGPDSNTIYADVPCGADAKATQVVTAPPAPTAPSPPTTKSLTPEIIAAARDHSARETSAALCSSNNFNEWIKAQGHPLPDPNVRMAKLMEISNQCRRPLNLPDMIPPPPIVPPKPILSGPAGDAAATMLAELVKSGSIERLRSYLSSPGVDINDRPGTDKALLDYAAEQNKADVARFLIEHGAHVDAMQNQGKDRGLTALHRAAIADAAEVAEVLLTHGAEVNFHGPLGITPLILSASNGSRRTAEVLLNHGANISTTSGHRETALSEAIAHDHMEIVQLLLTHVPANTIKDIVSVAGRGDLDTLRLILMHDELVHDVDTPSKDQALVFTILGGPGGLEERKQMIELLLAHGADIDHLPTGTVEIPVMYATAPEMIEFLLAHGANQKAQFPGAQLAMAYVCNKNVKDPIAALRVLVAHGIDIRGRPLPRSYSAMECASRSGNSAVVQFLKDQDVGRNDSVRVAGTPPAISDTRRPAASAQLVEYCRGEAIVPTRGSASIADPVQKDADDVPPVCQSTNALSGATINWLRAHLRGGNYGDNPDPMFDALRPGDGHVVILRSVLSRSTPATSMSADEQRRQMFLPRPQGEAPNSLYALLYKKGTHNNLLPLNYSAGDPPHIDMPWSPAELSVAYDAGSDKYLLYASNGVTFLTPSWNAALPTWEQFYVWWFDAKNEAIRRQLLPPGPWVTDAKLDTVLGRDLRNFSCGTDCYRHFEIKTDSGNILVGISGRSSAVSERVIGTYRLGQGDKAWKKIKDGTPE